MHDKYEVFMDKLQKILIIDAMRHIQQECDHWADTIVKTARQDIPEISPSHGKHLLKAVVNRLAKVADQLCK